MSKGLLRRTPSTSDLERLYYELAQLGAPAIGRKANWPYKPHQHEELLALAGEMLRFDARLLSILVQYFLKQWGAIHPVRLRRCMAAMRWPQALCVALLFTKQATSDRELHFLVDYLCRGWPRVLPAERFFIDSPAPGSRMAARRLGRNLRPYSHWGFIGQERPIVDTVTKRAVGRYDAHSRRAIARSLALRHGDISLAEYLQAVDHSISRQQALADLKAIRELTPKGHGRGARWRCRGAESR